MNLKKIPKVLIEKSFLSSFLAGLINFQNTILPKEATLHADSCLEYIYNMVIIELCCRRFLF